MKLTTEEDYKKQEAIATLNDAINQIYNIEGDRWQMAYDTLEAILSNLKIDGTPSRRITKKG